MALRTRNAHWKLQEITPRHWHALAHRHGGDVVMDALIDVVERVEPAGRPVAQRLPRGFPTSLFGSIAGGCTRQAAAFKRQLPAS